MKKKKKKCIDCGRKHPTWASCYFGTFYFFFCREKKISKKGIFICYDCSSKHRSYTPAFSFVR